MYYVYRKRKIGMQKKTMTTIELRVKKVKPNLIYRIYLNNVLP